ncbi:MAG: hypothetical protein GXO83_11070 [Chlorobi bacterium]|nr:hypothetical protein [Chlorobiota bacterium]
MKTFGEIYIQNPQKNARKVEISIQVWIWIRKRRLISKTQKMPRRWI